MRTCEFIDVTLALTVDSIDSYRIRIWFHIRISYSNCYFVFVFVCDDCDRVLGLLFAVVVVVATTSAFVLQLLLLCKQSSGERLKVR